MKRSLSLEMENDVKIPRGVRFKTKRIIKQRIIGNGKNDSIKSVSLIDGMHSW